MRRFIRILAVSYLIYLAVVLLLITPALNFLPAKYVKQYLDRDLQTDFIVFNPFTLSLDLYKTALPDIDGSPFVTLDKASINLSLASLWQPGVVFDAVEVAELFVHVKQAADGSFNFSDMIPPEDPDEPPAEPTAIPGITIGHLDFYSKQLMFSSLAREEPYSSQLDDITIDVLGLSTVLEEGKPYRLDARGEGGGELHWEGEVSVPRGTSEGTLRLTTLQLPKIWRLVEPWVNFEAREGTISVDGHYSIDWLDTLKYRVSQGTIAIQGVDLQPKAPETLADTDLSLGSLSLAGIELDSQSQHLGIESFAIEELAISGWSEGSQASLVDLFAGNLPQSDDEEPPAEEEAGDPDAPGWTAELKTFRLADSSVRWRSEFTDPALLEVTPITASATSIKWPLAGDTDLNLGLTINGETSTSVEGKLDLEQGAGQLAYKLEALPLAWFNPNLPAALQASISSGQLDVAGTVGLADFAPTLITADGAIKDFAVALVDGENSLTSWETVRWDQLAVNLEQRSVELKKLSIDDYTGRIHIKKDGSINAQNVWKAELAETSEQEEDTSPEVSQEEPNGEPWLVNVPLILFTDSEIDFMDESLPINFRTLIGDINGEIKGLTSKLGSATTVDIKGSVDGYAPVVLAGTAEPLTSPPVLDLGLSFEGVDMALLSPYSGTYAGYAIERGVLNLNLVYALKDDHLAGNNRILIDQMKLGEKIDSEQAADLPLELALALLTDSKGIIDMEIPVSGDVNDPEFSVGSVVLGAFVNLITKAVTAPFNLLAGLVGSEEDLQRLNFSSGSAELTDSTRAKLDDLSTALAKRSELNLAIIGRLKIGADRERLQKNILAAQLEETGISAQEWAEKGPNWEAAIEKRFQGQAEISAEMSIRDKYLALVKQIPLPDSALLELADARAVAVKTYLVNDKGMDASRAAIGQATLDKKVNLYSGVELAVDT